MEVQKHTISLAWSPPREPNGILTGYQLQYQLSTYSRSQHAHTIHR